MSGEIRKIVRKIVSKAKVVTKATRRPRRGAWPPDPARVRSIVDGLEELYPDVDCELDRETPFQLIIATILSAQTTDERVNMVTPELFRRYPTPEAMAKAPLTTLPGVARKTANVVLGTAYGLAEGVVVDTHVQRLSMRLALTRKIDPKDIEQDLMKVIPQENWIRFSHQLIWHGRRVCFARKPSCAACTLAPFCPSAGLEA